MGEIDWTMAKKPLRDPAPKDWFAAARDAERLGEHLLAYDRAQQGLAVTGDDLQLQYMAILALARSGATEHAAAMYEAFGLGASQDEDMAALGARIDKDKALDAPAHSRKKLLRIAAVRYETIYGRTGGYFPGINAATLHLLAGDKERAETLAREIEGIVGGEKTTVEGTHGYYAAATAAEAALILGDVDGAGGALERAARNSEGHLGAVATTRKQLWLICDANGIDPAVLAALAPRRVIHYSGHLIAAPGKPGRFPADAEAPVAAEIARILKARDVGFGYGSLACGADILFAEALLRMKAELHVVLPFTSNEFERVSVACGGSQWIDRFHSCLRQAQTVTYATRDDFFGDELLFDYAARVAMGLAVLRAQAIDAEVEQVVVWDGVRASPRFGTEREVERWTAGGRLSHIIDVSKSSGGSAKTDLQPQSALEIATGRIICSILFADMKGYSGLRETEIMAFRNRVMGAMAAVLEDHAPHIGYRNTWGDSIYLVFDEASVAAHCALDLQEALASFGPGELGLRNPIAFRMGLHIGPAVEGYDQIVEAKTVYGSHVTLTARIEPVVPPGQVYVTEPFAACLALEPGSDLRCEYVGHMPTAKNYGHIRMYLLKRRK